MLPRPSTKIEGRSLSPAAPNTIETPARKYAALRLECASGSCYSITFRTTTFFFAYPCPERPVRRLVLLAGCQCVGKRGSVHICSPQPSRVSTYHTYVQPILLRTNLSPRAFLQNMKSIASSQAVLHYVRRVKYVVIGSSFLWCQCTVCFSLKAAFDKPLSARTWLILTGGIDLTGIGAGILYFFVIGERRQSISGNSSVTLPFGASRIFLLLGRHQSPSCADGHLRRNTHACNAVLRRLLLGREISVLPIVWLLILVRA